MRREPASHDSPESAVRAALETLSSTRALARAPFAPVRGGLSNHAWRADLGGRSYFVRLGGPDAASLGVDRQSECTLLETVAAAGLAPRILACEPGNGLLVADFVQGEPWRREDAREPRNLARIARVLGTLHGLPGQAGVRAVSFRSQAMQLEAQLASAAVADPGLKHIADAAFEALGGRDDCITLCHNDLHHLNILDDGDRLWLVDWEYGGRGDPLFDLASYLCQHESTPAERDALLAAYGPAARASAKLVAAACTAFDYVQWLWYRSWVARGRDTDGEYAARAASVARRIRAGGA